MELKEALYIFTVAKYLSITRAAEELNISQPSLSKYLQSIERQYGKPFFNRIKNRLSFTTAGNLYVESAQQMLRINSNLERAMASLDDLESGKIVFGIPSIEGSIILPMVLPKFQALHPGIEVHIVEATSSKLEKAIKAGDIDFAVRHLPLSCPDLDSQILHPDEMVLIANRNRRLSGLAHDSNGSIYPFIDLKRLKSENFILLKQGMYIREISDKAFLRRGVTPKVVFETSNIFTAYRMVLAGYGLTIIPDATYALGKDADLDLFSFEKPSKLYDLVVCYYNEAYLSKASRAFISVLSDTIAEACVQ